MPIPVIIGVGQLKQQDTSPPKDPAQLAAEAVQLALADTTQPDAVRVAVSALHIVNVVSWLYDDIAAEVARRSGLTPQEQEHTDVGGHTPTRLLDEASARISAQGGRVEVVTGAEAMASLAAAMKAGKMPGGWPAPPKGAKGPQAEDYVPGYVLKHGLSAPIQMYPLYENARRAAHGQTPEENTRECAGLYAEFSEVAAQHEAAWTRTPMTAEQIGAVEGKNRMICFPYPLYMNALMNVNQAAAFIVTDTETAQRLGVPEEKWVYVWSGAGSNDSQDVLERVTYTRSPASEATLDAALRGAGLTADQVDLFDLYSCFPVVPKMAARHLNLPLDGRLTQTGGLTSFGGPGNNYTSHSIVNMVQSLRAGRGETGLVYGQGEFVTKHAASVLATKPSGRPYAANPLPKLFHESDPPTINHTPNGLGVIETYTVEYSREGQPTRGFIIGRLEDGGRFLANVDREDTATLTLLTDSGVEPIGQRGFVRSGAGGRNIFSFDETYGAGTFDTGYAEVKAEQREGVLIVTINRPEARNAISPEVTKGMNAALNHAEANDAIKAVIVTGADTKSFSAGADLKAVGQGRGLEIADPQTGFAGITNRRFSKPLIAAVNGLALGGGFEIALACDLVVAADHAQFGLPEVKRGIVAGAGGLVHLGRRIPRALALEMVMTGDPISAIRAQELGLVNRVVPATELLDAALELAARVTANGPLAVRLSKALVINSPDLTLDEAWKRSHEAGQQVMRSEDMKEGVRAFTEKRTPVWTGK